MQAEGGIEVGRAIPDKEINGLSKSGQRPVDRK